MQTRLLKDLKAALLQLNKTDWHTAGFNMRNWAVNKLPTSPELGCGTTCCAYGVGTTLPSWRKAGLGLDRAPKVFSTEFTPTRDAYKILEITESQWDWVFHLHPYHSLSAEISPLDVAAHIDDVLQKRVL